MHSRAASIGARLTAVAALLVAAAAHGHGGEVGAAPAAERLQPPTHAWHALRGATLDAQSARATRRASWVGRAYATQSGDVTVYVWPGYPDPDGVGLRWANFLSSLLHGSELGLVRAYVAPLAEVQAFCEADALGCYGANTLVSIGDAVDGVTAEEVMRHEYGHHVAANRQNPPWAAVDWGTKRWASRADVCARAGAETVFPGDEGLRYTLNPGEAFAETYRVLNELRAGAASFSWELVDPSFSPDARALAAVEEDALTPWVQRPAQVVAGRFRTERTWSRSIQTPLDGDLELTLRMPLGAGHTLDLLDSRGTVVAHGLWSGSGVRTLRYRICGQRNVRVRVGREGAPPRFQVRVRVP